MSMLIDDLLAAGADFDGVVRLLRQWGGLPLSVPMRADAGHLIAQIAGIDTMGALCRLRPGERIVLPLGRRVQRELQRRQIHELLGAGLNRAQIARRLGMHLRQVQRLALEAGGEFPEACGPANQLGLDFGHSQEAG